MKPVFAIPSSKQTRGKYRVVGRIGYAARGVIYLIIGGFAAAYAAGSRIRPVGSDGAFRVVLDQPLGQLALAILAAGFACFAGWRLIQAWVDVDHLGNQPAGLFRRAVYAANSLFYLGLAAWALAVLIGWDTGTGGDRSVRHWAAWLMTQPFGRWLVGMMGAAIAATGLAFALKAVRPQLESHLDLPAAKRRFAHALFRLGELGRAIVFVMIGGFLVVAAATYQSANAKGLPGALQTLAREPHGWILLGITALGLVAYGAHELVQAWFRRIDAATR